MPCGVRIPLFTIQTLMMLVTSDAGSGWATEKWMVVPETLKGFKSF